MNSAIRCAFLDKSSLISVNRPLDFRSDSLSRVNLVKIEENTENVSEPALAESLRTHQIGHNYLLR